MGLVFDGVDLESTYGFMIDGVSTWRKPERDREFVHVPGRNGDLIFDNGSWQNVEITYTMLIRDGWKTTFEDFAAWFCSHVGYFRLEDQKRHPGVYRMAEVGNPIDTELWFTTRTGVFELTFNCKPQQFLTSGEEPSEVTITPFSPLRWVYTDPEASGSADSLTDVLCTDGSTIATPWFLPIEGTEQSAIYAVLSLTLKTSDYSVLINYGREIYYGVGDYRGSVSENVNVRNFTISMLAMWTTQGYLAERLFVQTPGRYITDVFDISLTLNGVTVPVSLYGTKLTNPTPYESRPLIELSMQDNATLSVNDYLVTVSEAASDLAIDCDLEDCYDSTDYSNKNSIVTITNDDEKELRDFPYLKPGDNWVYVFQNSPASASISVEDATVTVTPRWYRV